MFAEGRFEYRNQNEKFQNEFLVGQPGLVYIYGDNSTGKTSFLQYWRDQAIKQKKKTIWISTLPVLLEELTVAENLSVAFEKKNFSDISKFNHFRNQILSHIGISIETLNTKVQKLSSGEKKKLAISIGLLSLPEIIFFDQPEAYFDPKTRVRLFDLLKYFNREFSTTIVWASACRELMSRQFNKKYQVVESEIMRLN